MDSQNLLASLPSQYRAPISSRTSLLSLPRPCLRANRGRRGERSAIAPLPGQSGPRSSGAHPRQCRARRPSCGSARLPRPPSPAAGAAPAPRAAAAAGRVRGLRAARTRPRPRSRSTRRQGVAAVAAARSPPAAKMAERQHHNAATLPGGRSGRLRCSNHTLRWGTLPGTAALAYGRADGSNRVRQPQGRVAEPSSRADRARGPQPSPWTLTAHPA